ncbi:MAG: hypothetical protein U5L07_19350 [Desulfobacterales bacterium]|nr:hypothetical protein [Desulfobacterales bacterium]
MGKKSLTKSTSKKKSTKKKTTAKSTSKKSVSENAKTQKNTSQKSGGKKKPTLKSLRKKDFGAWAPDTMYQPEPQTPNFSAPPAVEAGDKEMAEKLKTLLAKQFALSEKKKAAPKKTQKKKAAAGTAKKKAAPKKSQKKKISTAELLQKQFDAWTPKKPFKPDAAETGQLSAPPFTDAVDAEKLKELLFREFDLSKVTPKPPPEPEKPAPAEAAAEPEKPAEAEAPEAAAEAAQPTKAAEPEKPEAPAAEEPMEAAPAEETQPAAETEKPQERAEPEKEKAPEAAAEPEEKPAPEAPKAAEKKPAEKAKPQKPEDSPLAKPPGKPATPPPGGGGGEEPPGPPPPSGPQHGDEPIGRGLKILIIGIAALFACIILASALNSSKYYIKAGKEGTEIWKGDFSPRGKEKVFALKEIEPPEDISGAVSKQTAYELPFNYYMTEAEKLSEKQGTPDFAAIREQLKKAKKYAITRKQIQRVEKRIQGINRAMSGSKEGDKASQKPLPPPESPAKEKKSDIEKPAPEKKEKKAETPEKPKTKSETPSEEEHLM